MTPEQIELLIALSGGALAAIISLFFMAIIGLVIIWTKELAVLLLVLLFKLFAKINPRW